MKNSRLENLIIKAMEVGDKFIDIYYLYNPYGDSQWGACFRGETGVVGMTQEESIERLIARKLNIHTKDDFDNWYKNN